MAFRDEVQAAQARADAAELEATRLREELAALRSGRTDAWSAAAGSLAYVGIGGHVLALERRDATVRWQVKLAGTGTVLLTWSDDVLVASTRGELFRLDPASGKSLWHNGLPGMGIGLPSVWIPRDGFAPADTMLVGLAGKVVGIELATGAVRWKVPLGGRAFVGLTQIGGDLFASTGGKLWCLDPTTGEIRWFEGLRGRGLGLVCVAAGNAERAGFVLRAEELDEETKSASTG